MTAAAASVVRAYLDDTELVYEEAPPGTFAVVLPGEHKQRTAVSIVVGPHAVTFQAFVSRKPDENEAGVHRWLLERNRRTYAVAYCIDHLGDVYLSGRIAPEAISADEIDRVLGAILENADGAFDTILTLGFASAITREWQWRLDRGESTANLAAFEHLRPE